MASLKQHLKTAREAISCKKWAEAETAAEAALALDPRSYNAHVFLGLSYLNLNKLSQSQAAYESAIANDATQPLAWQGLVRLYEQSANVDGMIDALQGLAKIWNEKGDAEKLGESLLKLISLKDKSRKQTILTLSHLLPESPYAALLSTLPEPDPTNPNRTPLFDLQVMLQNTLPSLQKITDLTRTEENDAISREISKRRTRLTSVPKTSADTRLEVIKEFYPSSLLPNLWKQILDHPQADDEVRRAIELELLTYHLDWLQALPCPFKEEIADLSGNAAAADTESLDLGQQKQDDKDRLRNHILELAYGQVVLKIPNPKSWDIVLDWNEITGPGQTHDPRGYLISLTDVFPNSDISAVLDAHRLFHHRSELEDRPEEIEILQQMEEAFESAQAHSLLCHFLVLSVYYELRDWPAIKLVAENAISKVRELERLIGKRLTKAQRRLHTLLAIALTHFDPPAHHLRATRLIEEILSDEPDNGPILMAQAHIMKSARRWSDAIEYFNRGLRCWTDQPRQDRLESKSDKAWCLLEQGRVEDALNSFENIIEELNEMIEEAQDNEDLHHDLAQNWYRLGRCNWALVHSDIQPDIEDRKKFKGAAYSGFIRSIKCLASFAPPFTYLGLYYSEEGDHARASKCFQKAFELDATEDVAALRLATEFADEREWDLVEVVARRLITGGLDIRVENGVGQAPKSLQLASHQQHSWAWNAIGSAELSQGKFASAIGTFQRAIRATPSDPHTWIKLGLAYRGDGKHVAALKSFIRARQLIDQQTVTSDEKIGQGDSTRWFSDFCIGDVQRRIGLIEPAITAFEKIVSDQPEEVAVKIILAETRYASATEFAEKGEFIESERELIKSLDLVREVFEGSESKYTMRAGWKIAGDVFSEFARWNKTIPITTFNTEAGQDDLSERLKIHITFYVDLAARIGVDGKLPNVDSVTCLEVSAIGAENGSSGLLLLASIIVSKVRVALELSDPDSTGSAQAWADLAMLLGKLSRWLDTTSRSSSFTDQSTFFKTQAGPESTLRQAIRCIRSALNIESSNSNFWNTLGTLAFTLSPRLCQHAYIKSVELNPNNHIGWTNLGFFYLAHSDVQLANQAFLKSQTYEPDWALAWLGQALVAGLNEHMKESTELVEHAFTLSQSNVTQIDLTYATIAFGRYADSFSIPNEVDELLAPLLGVSKLLKRFSQDATILNLHGVLSEAIGKYDEAYTSLEKAAEILEAVYEETESAEVENRFAIVNLNLGRIRLKNGDYEGSISAFEVVESLRPAFEKGKDRDEDTERIIIIRAQASSGIALARYFLGDHEAAILGFKTTLGELSKIDGSESLILTKAIRRHISALARLLSRVMWSSKSEGLKTEAREMLLGVATRNLRSKYIDLDVVTGLMSISILDEEDETLEGILSELRNEDEVRLGRGLKEGEDEEIGEDDEEMMNDFNSFVHRLSELREGSTNPISKRETNTILKCFKKLCVMKKVEEYESSSWLPKVYKIVEGSREGLEESEDELKNYAQLQRIKDSNAVHEEMNLARQRAHYQGLCLPD